MGPTAAGKTALAVALVGRLPFEIISVDSAMVYRGMDIGTGKPSPEVRAQAPHWLIDICDPEEVYSAAAFRGDALRAVAEIAARGKTPLLVGGTGLYFRALRDGLARLPAADAAVRARIEGEARSVGWPALHERLAAVDPQAAGRIHPHDPQRIQRALEVYELTGCPMSSLVHGASQGNACALELSHRVLPIALVPGRRPALHERIGARFREMLAQGLIEEVATLRARPRMHSALPAMRAVGYRQVWDYLEGGSDYAAMVQRSMTATRRLARRQLTWLRSERGVACFDSEDPRLLERVLAHLDQALGQRSGA